MITKGRHWRVFRSIQTKYVAVVNTVKKLDMHNRVDERANVEAKREVHGHCENGIVHVETTRDNNEQVIDNMYVSARSAKNSVQHDLADESRTCKYMSAQIVPASIKSTSAQELLCR